MCRVIYCEIRRIPCCVLMLRSNNIYMRETGRFLCRSGIPCFFVIWIKRIAEFRNYRISKFRDLGFCVFRFLIKVLFEKKTVFRISFIRKIFFGGKTKYATWGYRKPWVVLKYLKYLYLFGHRLFFRGYGDFFVIWVKGVTEFQNSWISESN